MRHANLRAASKAEYGQRDWDVTESEIRTGALQRIADAVEKMSANYTAMQEEHDRYRRWLGEEQIVSEQLRRRVRALKGVVTRLKRGRP